MTVSLTELVRLLEQRDYIFVTDPATITEQLRHDNQDNILKLHRRAELIDRNHALADRLSRQQRYIQWVLYAATVGWTIMGFAGTYGLMQHSVLNFFVVLMGILGFNTIMLLIWLFNVLTKRQFVTLIPPIENWKVADEIAVVMMQLYHIPTFRLHTLWRRAVLMHRLAFFGLLGMFVAALLLLLVRQYQFTWESTLLTNQGFTSAILVLAWLPEKLGFNVPDTAAVLASRNQLDVINAASWGSLLLGSLLCYGIVPRLLALIVSMWQARRHQPTLDIQLPYYQNIIQRWQRKIVDSERDYVPDVVPQSTVSSGFQAASQYWAVAVDVLPEDNPQWYQGILAQEWLNQGVVASRDDWAGLRDRLLGQSVGLLVAIRLEQTPDRGTVRRLAGLGGVNLTIWLWGARTSDAHQERLMQWHEVCKQYGWVYLNH